MSQKLGMSASTYQEWDAVMQHCGTSIESMQSGMKTLASAAETGNAAFEQLGLSQQEIANMSQEELFSATITALQNVTDETERTYLAGKLLGKGATELGALLNTSAEDTQAMKDRVHELGGVMSDEAVKAAAAYQDSLQDMKTAFSGLSRGLTAEFMPSITTIMDGLTEMFSGDGDTGIGMVKDGINDFVDTIEEAIPQIAERGGEMVRTLSTAITEALPLIIASGAEILEQLVLGIVDALPTLLDAGASVVQSIADGIAGSGEILETALDSVEAILTGIVGVSEGTAQGVTDALSAAWEAIESIFTAIGYAITALVEALQESGIDWETVWAEVSETISIAGELIATVIEALADAIKWLSDEMNTEGTLINLVWENMKISIKTAIDLIQGAILVLIALLNGDFSGAWEAAKETGAAAWDGMTAQAENGMDYICGKVESGMDSINSEFESGLSSADGTTESKFGSIFEKIRSKMQAAYDAVAGVIEKIKAKFNFSWSLPSLKLPHISISGSFSLNPPSVPRFSIAWYKKAMDIPMILSGATIFGAMGGSLLGGGESGSEIVAGQETLMGMIREASGAGNEDVVRLLSRISSQLDTNGNVVNLVSPDGTKFASWLFKPLANYAKSNGTPIINPT